MVTDTVMATSREQLLELDKQKKEIEHQLQLQWDILKQNNIGMTEGLVDADDYPLTDVDVHQVRLARHQIKCLQNDHTRLLKQLERGLEDFHQGMQIKGCVENEGETTTSVSQLEAFCRVGDVKVTSPAYVGGLCENDLILKFGSVTSENFRNIASIGDVVKHSKNQVIKVMVKRGDEVKAIYVTPKPWNGKGLLGCNVLPYDSPDR